MRATIRFGGKGTTSRANKITCLMILDLAYNDVDNEAPVMFRNATLEYLGLGDANI